MEFGETKAQVLFFSFFILFIFSAFAVLAVVTYRLQNQKRSLCPYTNKPMWRGEDVPLSSVEKIMRFLYYKVHSYENRVFPMRRAMVCRDTGKIFPFCVSWWGFQTVDWKFLQKRYPGVYVSWGSLSKEQKDEIKKYHRSLEGFETEFSSMNPSPRDVEKRFAYSKPGPLYVDLDTKVLLGWKCVPDTLFEVLVVQKPEKPPGPVRDRIIANRR
ncbi:MAG: hypothetical protein VX777_05475 [Chlamydiota bacterium]|nr:hypothetical protein [Chlamydiota bacterium]